MGEGIDIYHKAVRSNINIHGKTLFQQQAVKNIESDRESSYKSLKPLIGTTVRLKGKRKEIDVVIDRDSVSHISNDIALGIIPRGLKDNVVLKSCLEKSVQDSISPTDKSGNHAKAKRVKDFRYFRFTYGKKVYYANIASVAIGKGLKMKSKYRLHAITRKLKE